MKTVVAVVLHDRIANLERWLTVWKAAGIQDAELRVIHNLPQKPIPGVREMCAEAGVTYIPRKNVGYDIGVLQDVCRRRLAGFKHDFEYLLWCTDDTYPMRASFVQEFVDPLSDPTVGITCFEISPEVKKHIRTTGFCLRASTLPKIAFDAEPIVSKDDCYKFEHRSSRSLYNQILGMGLKAVQIAPVPQSPVWDSGGGGRGWTDRHHEFFRVWKINKPPAKVIIIAPAFNRYPMIVPSMLEQTYTNWELYLVHDGPAPHDYPRFNDDRVIFYEHERRRKEYGHPIRIEWLQKIRDKKIDGDYVVVTNEDNYHAPFFIEKLVKPLEQNSLLIGSYCSMMVHNYQGPPGEGPKEGDHFIDGYGVIETKPQIGYIDCAAALVRADIAGKSGWPSTRHSSDWDYLNRIATMNGGWHKFTKVFGALLVHN